MAVCACSGPEHEPIAEYEPIVLPTDYQGGLFYAEPITTGGDTLRFLTDTGGGLYMYADVAHRLWGADSVAGEPMQAAPLPELEQGSAIPLPDVNNGFFPLTARSENGWFRNERDGMLGHAWFRNRTWTFDYANEQLLYHKPGELDISARSYVESLYDKNEWGEKAHHYPAVHAVIEQDTLRFLFDTGATLILTDAAYAALNDGLPQRRGASFMASTRFDLLRERYPTWTVIEAADSVNYEPLLEVPEIIIARQKVGPVWFTRRDVTRFREIVVPIVGYDVEGALGGSAFRYFNITVDYQKGIASFEKIN